ncbi:VOC family protein [Streptomyces tibetensis]|uniref:VOC family protein n=1 Tax=Streptomyces tibetensis TaxID=2382123 RepID=UPI0033D9D33A
MITALDHVQLAAPPGSEERLRAYYVDVLGMTEVPKPPALARRGGCWFRAGAVQLHLGIEEDFRAAGKAHPGLRVTDIEAYAARLEASGVAVRWDSALPGHQRFYAQDPVGNRLEFLEASRP